MQAFLSLLHHVHILQANKHSFEFNLSIEHVFYGLHVFTLIKSAPCRTATETNNDRQPLNNSIRYLNITYKVILHWFCR